MSEGVAGLREGLREEGYKYMRRDMLSYRIDS
jgi:hypothetical protein